VGTERGLGRGGQKVRGKGERKGKRRGRQASNDWFHVYS